MSAVGLVDERNEYENLVRSLANSVPREMNLSLYVESASHVEQ